MDSARTNPSDYIAEIAAQLKAAQGVEEALSQLADNPASQAAVEAAYASVDGQILAARDQVVAYSDEMARGGVKRTQLEGVRTQMLALELDTSEVDAKLTELTADPIATEVIAYAVGRGLLATVAQVETVEEPVTAEPAETEARRLFKIGFVVHETSGPILKIGTREIKLSGRRHSNQKDYSAQRFAAVAALAELDEDEELRSGQLWSRMHQLLGYEETEIPEFSRDDMAQVRSFLNELRYRNQAIFEHNKTRGPFSAYYKNPDLAYGINLDGSPDDVQAFAQQLAARTAADEVLANDPIHTYEPEPQEPAPDLEWAPTILELNTFLVKIQATLTKVADQLNLLPSSMLYQLAVVAEVALEYFEDNCADVANEQAMSQEALDAVRSQTLERLMSMTEDTALFNSLLSDEIKPHLDARYGGSEATGHIQALVETILDMTEEEKDLLKQIVVADGRLEVTAHDGTFAHGIDIVGAAVQYDDFPSEETDIGHIVIDPPIEAEPIVVAEPPVELVSVVEEDNPAVTDDLNLDEAPIDNISRRARRLIARQEHESPDKLIRRAVGEVIDTLKGANIFVDTQTGFNQAKAKLNLKTSHVVNARENNLISEEVTGTLGFKELALILVANHSDPKVRRLVGVRHLKRDLQNHLDQTIQELLAAAKPN